MNERLETLKCPNKTEIFFYFNCCFNVERMRAFYFLHLNFSHTKKSSMKQQFSFQKAPV